MSNVQVISTKIIKRNEIKLPHELANDPRLSDAKVEANDSVITFTLPAKSKDSFIEIWQYVHNKNAWVIMNFNS